MAIIGATALVLNVVSPSASIEDIEGLFLGTLDFAAAAVLSSGIALWALACVWFGARSSSSDEALSNGAIYAGASVPLAYAAAVIFSGALTGPPAEAFPIRLVSLLFLLPIFAALSGIIGMLIALVGNFIARKVRGV